jgi:hypothetical protein
MGILVFEEPVVHFVSGPTAADQARFFIPPTVDRLRSGQIDRAWQAHYTNFAAVQGENPTPDRPEAPPGTDRAQERQIIAMPPFTWSVWPVT